MTRVPTYTDGRLSSSELRDAAGITHRQIHYWADAGVFGPEYVNLGSGARRRFPPTLVEAVMAAGDVSRFIAELIGGQERGGGATCEFLTRVVDVVRSAPVDDGEQLVIDAAGAVYRFGDPFDACKEHAGPLLVMPLRAYAP